MMAKRKPLRVTAEMDGPFVVFLIGMRVNKWWRLDRWIPVAMAMSRMLKELEQNPEAGLLGWHGGASAMIQYWRSVEQLNAYASAKDAHHRPAWTAFMRAAAKSNDAVGVWHETYEVQPGHYETMYVDMRKPVGVMNFGNVVPATGGKERAAGRMNASG